MLAKIFNLRVFLVLAGGLTITMAVMGLGIYLIIVPKLPSTDSLKDIHFQVPLRIFSRDEKLIAEFGEKKRIPMKADEIPQLLINAVLAAEDDRFYEHHGVDYRGMLRAVFYLLRTGRKGQGGSTITMQVARNFFLSREKTYLRKLNEILLSFKIEQELSKQEILSLYLNKIYLGNRSYGFAAAAQVYYGLNINDLNPAQAAMVAGLPKAPSRYNPIINPKRALLRRNYVLGRMHDLEFLNDEEYKTARESVDNSELNSLKSEVSAPYIAEMVRAEMVGKYGKEAYTEGYNVYTTVTYRLQRAANQALRKALLEYDVRHGYRGPEAHVDLYAQSADGKSTSADTAKTPEDAKLEQENEWRSILSDFSTSNNLYPALVLAVGEKDIVVYQRSYGKLLIEWKGISWAKPWRGDGRNPGAAPKTAADIVEVGDIIRIDKKPDNKWVLSQVPNVEGALVSLDSKDGSIMALLGGFDFRKSNFNRVTQAERQPGSNLKPFNYSAALNKGFTAATLINDAPVVFEDAGLESTWRPENYSGKVFGPTRLREALVKSRNLVSIRILRAIGISYAIKYYQKFGFRKKSLPRDLSLALGSAAITPLELVTAYTVFANGGYKVEPYLIDRIEDADGNVVMQANPATVCEECESLEADQAVVSPDASMLAASGNTELDAIPNTKNTQELHEQDGYIDSNNVDENGESIIDQPTRHAERIISAENVYVMTSIMRDVIKRGTGRRARQLGRGDLAGKTGTTNDQRDAWFSGFNPEVVTTAWVGFDTPKTLGDRETGGRAALPMWIYYMKEALRDVEERQFERPPGLVTVRIDPDTGLPVSAGNPKGIFEVFPADNVPQRMADGETESGGNVIGGESVSDSSDGDDDDMQIF